MVFRILVQNILDTWLEAAYSNESATITTLVSPQTHMVLGYVSTVYG